jgi:hypothetical protein
LQRYPGRDQFTFFLVDGRRRVQIDFPNLTTAYTPELARSLAAMLGRDAVHIV